MNQVILGAAAPFLLALLIYLVRRMRAGNWWLVLTPLLMVMGSVWAVLPDIPRLLGMRDLYFRLAEDPRTDIFLFHYTIDRIEIDTPWWGALFVLMAGTMLAIAWRELRRCERVHRA